MKTIHKICYIALGISALSCNKFLDREPLSDVTPQQFFNSEADLATYTITQYNFPTHNGWNAGTFINDNGTDNQVGPNASSVWKKGEWRVPASDRKGEGYHFYKIREINYFLSQVLPKFEKKQITGNETNIKHYIGEAYFLRAYEYFNKLTTFGDYPIIDKVLPDSKEILIEASIRQPRNKVARFILDDLTKAIEFLKSGNIENKNRISKEVALLFRSRVALFEGTWLKYHKGTDRVPGGPNWPGIKTHPNFTIDIDQEIDYFLTQAMENSKTVADAIPLVNNNHITSGKNIFENPYFKMFGDIDMSGYNEVLLWRRYNSELGVGHKTIAYLQEGASTGYTRDFVESFLMKNGLPIYTTNSTYQGDETYEKVKANRDERLQLFMRTPGDYIVTQPTEKISSYPNFIGSIPENRPVTGYEVTKGLYNDSKFIQSANLTTTGSIVFRATEAYLNYIEASYEKEKSLNSTALSYWKQLRNRAGLPENPNVTINATDLNQERDWAVYSSGAKVDPTLYNIRRERRCEFIAEGMRWNDLKRWCSLDQINNYQIEGINLWTEIYKNDMYYQKEPNGAFKLVDGQKVTAFRSLPESNPNISSKTLSKYIRPYQIVQVNNPYYDGLNWTPTHYLSPIAFSHFQIASKGNVDQSLIYQNPGWPVQSNGEPIK